jgi:hypothetical protein
MVAIIRKFRTSQRIDCFASRVLLRGIPMVIAPVPVNLLFADGVTANNVRSRIYHSGQVAQVVERSPEKAGVGGSTPSLATILSITCTSGVSLFGCFWLQFPSETQLIVVPRLLNLLTTRCWLSGTNC